MGTSHGAVVVVLTLALRWACGQAAAVAASSNCGACLGTCNEELGRCDCLRGYTGKDCSTPPHDLPALCKSLTFKPSSNCSFEPKKAFCINACNGRGKCVAGVCLCDAGYYGIDCCLSLDAEGKPELLAGLGYKTRARRPHIYVYELPPKFTTWPNRMDRPLAQMLHQRILSSGARVADGNAADYFYVPLNMRSPSDSALLLDVLRYIRTTWPWWNRYHGERHLLVHVGDPGRGDVLPSIRHLTENCTYLHHWGLYQDYAPSGWRAAHRPGRDIVVPLFISPHSGHGAVFKSSPLHPRHPSRSGTASSARDSRGASNSEDSGNSRKAQGRGRGRELKSRSAAEPTTAPATFGDQPQAGNPRLEGWGSNSKTESNWVRALTAAVPASRAALPAGPAACGGEGVGPSGATCKSLELVFAGRVCGGGEQPDSSSWPNCRRGINNGYSQGARQMVHYHHWNRSGYSITTVSHTYLADLSRSRFCLAPTGGGHGHRQILVAFAGCIPLLIGDHVHQPFEPELDWSRFSIAIPQVDIPTLHERLATVDQQQYEELQAGLRCGAEHLTYSSMVGGFKWDSGKWDAFETLMEILRARLDHPGVPPEQLAQADPQLAAFMQCREPGQDPSQQKQLGGKAGRGRGEPHEPKAQPRGLTCSLSTFDGKPAPCERCLRGMPMAAIPGGAACCGAPSLAQCPRVHE